MRLAGKVAVVTGGGRGVGLEVARALAREGAAVTIADLGTGLDGEGRDGRVADDAVADIRAAGGAGHAVTADVGDPEQAAGIVAETVERFGKVDVLVNVAGNLRPGSILDLEPDDWAATFRTHVDGTVNTTRAVAAHWASTPGSSRRLINFSSDAGLFGDSEYIAYGAAKAAVVAFTLGCVEPLRELAATANVFIPQAATRMTESIPLEQLPDAERWQTGEFHPAHVPPALLYLASDAGGWVSGQIVGGWGFEVHLYAKPARVRSMFNGAPWDLDSLFGRFRDVFESSIEEPS